MKSLARKPGAGLPLGVDLGHESVSVVAGTSDAGGFSLVEGRTLDVAPATRFEHEDLAVVATIRAILAALATRERRCILAAPAGEVVIRPFRVPPGMKRREAVRAATLEADAVTDWPPSDRLVALDPIPGRREESLLSIARKSTLERIASIARAGGLKPIAIDVPACAWKRALPNVDALLDCSRERATLEIFGDPIGATHVFAPRLIDERIAASLRSAFVEARRDGVADVQRIAVLGTPLRVEVLETLLRDDGYVLSPVLLADIPSPPWALAYGLATWSTAARSRKPS